MDKIETLKNFYKNKKVYITGITGFKGTWLAIMLKKLGADVYGIGLFPKSDSLFNLIALDKEVTTYFGDITNSSENSTYSLTLSEVRPDVVFHLANKSIVSESYKNPIFTFNTNVMGTVITHELLRGLNKKISLINSTSNKIYDNPKNVNEVFYNTDPSSVSKNCSDLITLCYSKAFYSKVVSSTVKTGNVIGGGDFTKDKLIPETMMAFIKNDVLKIRNPNSVRSYQYIFDVLMAQITLAMYQYEDETLASSYQIEPESNQIINTRDLIHTLESLIPLSVEYSTKENQFNQLPIPTGSKKIKKNTNWVPVYDSIEKELNATIFWYNSFIENKDLLISLEELIEGGFYLYDKENH